METRPSDANAGSPPAPPVVSQAPRQPPPRLIRASLVLTEVPEMSDSDVELIEMRYQQMLALMNLEILFAEGQLDRM